MLLAAALTPTSHVAHILPIVATEPADASPPKRTPHRTPLDQGLGGLAGPASTIACLPSSEDRRLPKCRKQSGRGQGDSDRCRGRVRALSTIRGQLHAKLAIFVEDNFAEMTVTTALCVHGGVEPDAVRVRGMGSIPAVSSLPEAIADVAGLLAPGGSGG